MEPTREHVDPNPIRPHGTLEDAFDNPNQGYLPVTPPGEEQSLGERMAAASERFREAGLQIGLADAGKVGPGGSYVPKRLRLPFKGTPLHLADQIDAGGSCNVLVMRDGSGDVCGYPVDHPVHTRRPASVGESALRIRDLEALNAQLVQERQRFIDQATQYQAQYQTDLAERDARIKTQETLLAQLDADIDRIDSEKEQLLTALTELKAGDRTPLDDLDQMVNDLTQWWVESATGDIGKVAPKAAEYGSVDLVIMGEGLLQNSHSRWAEADAKEKAQVGQEMALAFYLLGKVSRMISAYAEGRFPSDDTIDDAVIYATMTRFVRQFGAWDPRLLR